MFDWISSVIEAGGLLGNAFQMLLEGTVRGMRLEPGRGPATLLE